MCEFCLKHGEGKKWYLQAQNYSEDLLSDIRRQKFIRGFFQSDPAEVRRSVAQIEKLDKVPGVLRGVVQRMVTGKMKKQHFGQVIPIEDVEHIFDMVSSIVRVACYCRNATIGEGKRYCYGVSMSPNARAFSSIIGDIDTAMFGSPDNVGLETLTKEQALEAFREHEREGLCHTVWTFGTPFIGGICNCDRTDCLAMRCTVTHEVPVMFRAEYVAEVDRDKCNGCRQCMRLCQFGAMGYSAANKKATIDQRWCYGCGVCRAGCSKGAITLKPREEVPVAAGKW